MHCRFVALPTRFNGLADVSALAQIQERIRAAVKCIEASAGEDWKESARFTTTGLIGLAGLAVQAGGDWGVPLSDGDRILVKNQNGVSSDTANGIYLARPGAWERPADAVTGTLTSGALVPVTEGVSLNETVWQLATNDPIVVGATPLQWINFQGQRYFVGTRAELAAVSGLHNGDVVYVAEVNAPYRWDAADVGLDNGWTRLQAAVGAGRWVLAGEFIDLPIRGGTLDDWANFKAAVAACAEVGAELHFRPGTYRCDTTGRFGLKSGVKIVGTPQTVIQSSLAPSGGPVTATVFDTGRKITAPVPPPSTTLSVGNTIGTRTVSVVSNAGISAGTVIGIQRLAEAGTIVLYYTVLTVAGGGPYVLTLDRAVLVSFAAADTVWIVGTQPENITIEGNGMLVTGTGDTALSLWEAKNCHIRNVRVDSRGGSLSDYAATIDIGCEQCSFAGIKVEASGLGFAASSVERCAFVDCYAERIGLSSPGFTIMDTIDSSMTRCSAVSGTGHGAQLASNGNTVGNRGLVVSGCDFTGNGASGVVVTTSSFDTKLDSCSTNYNTLRGLDIETADGTEIVDHEARGNGGAGVFLGATATRTTGRGIYVSDNVSYQLDVAADIWINGFVLNNASVLFGVLVRAGAKARIANFDLGTTAGAVARCADVNGEAYFDGGRGSAGAGMFGIVVNGSGVCHVRDVTIGGAGVSLYVFATGTLYFDEGMNIAAATYEAGSYISRGTVVANNAVGVDVLFPDIRSTHRVLLTMATPVGPTAMPKIAITAGSKFTLTSYAGDTSTYNYVVV